jgi:hypothetical protein
MFSGCRGVNLNFWQQKWAGDNQNGGWFVLSVGSSRVPVGIYNDMIIALVLSKVGNNALLLVAKISKLKVNNTRNARFFG